MNSVIVVGAAALVVVAWYIYLTVGNCAGMTREVEMTWQVQQSSSSTYVRAVSVARQGSQQLVMVRGGPTADAARATGHRICRRRR